jgi:hypothetical protein
MQCRSNSEQQSPATSLGQFLPPACKFIWMHGTHINYSGVSSSAQIQAFPWRLLPKEVRHQAKEVSNIAWMMIAASLS